MLVLNSSVCEDYAIYLHRTKNQMAVNTMEFLIQGTCFLELSFVTVHPWINNLIELLDAYYT